MPAPSLDWSSLPGTRISFVKANEHHTRVGSQAAGAALPMGMSLLRGRSGPVTPIHRGNCPSSQP